MQDPVVLLLADGRKFDGEGFGASTRDRGPAFGEIVFNTAMQGYQEILTDPSYTGQLVCMTQPLMGNYGANDGDIESHSRRIYAAGFIVREASAHFSNYRAKMSLGDYLARENIAGIHRIDTRALTRHIRDHGAQTGAIAPRGYDLDQLAAEIRAWGTMDGKNLTPGVTCAAPYVVEAVGPKRFTVAAYDFGAKQNIFRLMAQRGIETHVFPESAKPDALLAVRPDGLFLSNGPGDPAACVEAIANIRALLGQKPLFGICLGHQLLALAIGARTYKLPFGHHGGNHPVKNLVTGKIEITSQNHGFAVDEASLLAVGAFVTHVNLNDGSNEGLRVEKVRASSVQYHPEAAPGPHDAEYLFDDFVRQMELG
jgi:carbamoyl-phosphate synthase small subunit